MKTASVSKREKQYRERIDSELRNEYEILSEFNGLSKPIQLKHVPCGHVRNLVEARDVFRKGCPVCEQRKDAARRKQKKAVGYIQEIETRFDVVALTEYMGARIPMQFRCNDCGNIIERTVEEALWRSGVFCECKYPNMCKPYNSQGTLMIEDYLNRNGIKFEREVTFESCKRINKLPFDFAIYDNKDNLIMLIEFNGEQHYVPKEKFGGEESYRLQVERDRIKKTWCELFKIKLAVIRFDDNIEERLDELFDNNYQ